MKNTTSMGGGAGNIASYFIEKALRENKSITNLVTLKMLYYSQGFNFTLFNKPAFRNSINAWEWGPVVPAVYSKYDSYGSHPILHPVRPFEYSQLACGEALPLYDAVWENLIDKDPFELSDYTHNELPWKKNYKSPEQKNVVIPIDDIRWFFQSDLNVEHHDWLLSILSSAEEKLGITRKWESEKRGLASQGISIHA